MSWRSFWRISSNGGSAIARRSSTMITCHPNADFTGPERRVHLYWHSVANRLLTALSNMLNDINLTDMGTCYKCFRSSKLDFPLHSNGFGIEAEITAKVCKRKLRIYAIPISYSGRTYAEGKKITWKDGFVYLWCLLKYRLMD